jgi:hypothetical protein
MLKKCGKWMTRKETKKVEQMKEVEERERRRDDMNNRDRMV